MRIKIYRKSAPNMEPLLSEPITNLTRDGLGAAVWNAFIRGIAIEMGGHETFVNATDISYIQIIEED